MPDDVGRDHDHDDDHDDVPDGPVVRRSGWSPVMGTDLRLEIVAATDADAARCEASVIDAARSWEARLTRFDDDSDLCRWRDGRDDRPSAVLGPVLARALWWQRRSGGAFNVLTAAVTERWLAAGRVGVAPSDGELEALADAIRAAPYDAEPCAWALGPDDPVRITRLGDCNDVDVHAIAKGWIVGRLADAAMSDPSVIRVVVDAGGDLVHRGAGSLIVGVEDPWRAYDNVAPAIAVEVTNAAIATSGNARRWFEVGGERWSRVLDPRRARPVAHSASATAIAPDAATADALATVASVLDHGATRQLVDELRAEGLDVSTLVISSDRGLHRAGAWCDLEVGNRGGKSDGSVTFGRHRS